MIFFILMKTKRIFYQHPCISVFTTTRQKYCDLYFQESQRVREEYVVFSNLTNVFIDKGQINTFKMSRHRNVRTMNYEDGMLCIRIVYENISLHYNQLRLMNRK